MQTCCHIIKSASVDCTGICQVALGLAPYAAANGFALRVIFLEDGPLAAQMREGGLTVDVIPWTASAHDVQGAWRFWRWLRNYPNDIVHFHHGGRLARMLARLAGSDAVIRHMHGRVEESSQPVATTTLLRNVDAVIACSQAVATCIANANVEVIYSGIEVEDHPPDPPSVDGPLRIGVLSRLVPIKNVGVLIEACACLSKAGNDVQVEILGTGPSEAELRRLAAKLGIDEKMRFLGWQQNVRPHIASWHMLAMPSLEEGLPMAVLEAMACGRAVIASDVGGLSEMVVNGVTGRLVPAGDVDALTNCLAELNTDRASLLTMGREAWKRAARMFSSKQMAEKTFALYRRLAPAAKC